VAVERLFQSARGGWVVPHEDSVSSHQLNEFAAVADNPFVLITGVPGAGKTHLLAAAVRAAACRDGLESIAVCAPTGKAAVRITQALLRNGINLEATTTHRLLGVQRNGHDGDGWSFRFDANNPLPYRYVCCDEMSMMDVPMMYNLLTALAPGTCFIGCGDPHQLPPVSHGAVLRDMVAANLPRCHLTEIQRNSGLITAACRAILAGDEVEFAEQFNIPEKRNLRFVNCDTERDQLDALGVFVQALQRKPECNIFDDLQVLAPRNEESGVSVKALNKFLQAIINPPREGDPLGKAEGFRLRDKVMCRSNTFTKRYTLGELKVYHAVDSWQEYQGTLDDPEKAFIANGDMGRVVAVSDKRAEVIVRFSYPTRFVKWRIAGKKQEDDAKIGGGKDDLVHAYAVTNHKFQGSECPYVIQICDSAGDRVASQEYWYTGISRATVWSAILGQRKVFERQRRRAELPGRKTFLKELLFEGEQSVAT